MLNGENYMNMAEPLQLLLTMLVTIILFVLIFIFIAILDIRKEIILKNIKEHTK